MFSEPQYPNWILIGIILHKSETKFTNDKKKSRYLKLSIGNFNNLSLDLLLFNDAYTKYWKSRVGDVIAILNPTIKPYRISLTSNNSAERAQNLNPRGFNLALDDSSDCLLEIGTARDFGFCKSIKKDGHRCLTPVNTKKFEYCNFHQELAIRKTGSKRMELSGSITMKSPSRLDGSKKAMYLNRNGNNNNNVGGHMITDYSQYKAPTENLYYSGHSFFKDEYTNPKMLENLGEKRRKLKDKREDHELQKKLNNIKSQASLRSLGLSNSRPKEINKQPIEKIAFNQSIVKQIGFNPATTSSIAIQDGGIYKSPTKRRKELADNLQELYDLSNLNASKKLTASLEDKLDKQKKWKANINNLQLYKSSSQSQTKSRPRSNSIGLEPSPFLDTKDKKEVISGEFSDSDSDSDIEIEFNNETERRNYSNLANKK